MGRGVWVSGVILVGGKEGRKEGKGGEGKGRGEVVWETPFGGRGGRFR